MATRISQSVNIDYNAKTRQLSAQMGQIQRMHQRTSQAMADQIGRVAGGWNSWKTGLVTAQAAISLVSQGMRALGAVLSATSGAALEESNAFSQLADSLAVTGIAWEDSRDRVLAFADAIQATTRVGDDSTARIIQQVAGLTRGLELNLDEILQLSQATIDITESTGQSVESVGRALARVRAGEFGAMGRFLPGMDAQLEALEASGGSAAEAIDMISTAFAGAASAGDSLSIEFARMTNAGGDVMETLGGIINNALRSSGVVGTLSDRLDSLAIELADANTTAGRLVREGMSAILSTAEFVVVAVARVAQGVRLMADAMAVGRESLTDFFLAVDERGATARLQRQLADTLDLMVQLRDFGEIRTGTDVLGQMGLAPEAVSGDPVALMESLRERAVAIQLDMDRVSGGFEDARSAQQAEIERSLENLVSNAQNTQNIIEEIQTGADAMRAGIAESFDRGAVTQRGGIGGGGDGVEGDAAGGALETARSIKEGLGEILQQQYDEQQAIAEKSISLAQAESEAKIAANQATMDSMAALADLRHALAEKELGDANRERDAQRAMAASALTAANALISAFASRSLAGRIMAGERMIEEGAEALASLAVGDPFGFVTHGAAAYEFGKRALSSPSFGGGGGGGGSRGPLAPDAAAARDERMNRPRETTIQITGPVFNSNDTRRQLGTMMAESLSLAEMRR